MRLVLAVTIGLVVGLAVHSAPAQDAIERLRGLFASYTIEEEYEISVGVDGLGNHRKPVRQKEIRSHLNLPEHYGRLVEITQVGPDSILWFRDEQGLIRNAVLPSTASTGYRIQPFATTRFRAHVIGGGQNR